MVELGAVHSMLIEMHGGMLTLAGVCLLAIVLSRFHQRMRKRSKAYGVFWPLDSIAGKLVRYTEPTAYLAGIGGVIGLVVSSIVGFYVWPAEALLGSPLGLTKVMFTIFATELWILFVIVRSKFGEGLWNNGMLAASYVLMGLAGFLFTVLAGSFGGHMAGKGSVLDPVYELVGVNPDAFWVITFEMVPLLIAAAFIIAVASFAIFLRLRR